MKWAHGYILEKTGCIRAEQSIAGAIAKLVAADLSKRRRCPVTETSGVVASDVVAGKALQLIDARNTAANIFDYLVKNATGEGGEKDTKDNVATGLN